MSVDVDNTDAIATIKKSIIGLNTSGFLNESKK